MKKPIIEHFTIYGMHGHKNIQIDFATPYSILLSENGQGKTTILKIIDATLNGNIKKLRDASFNSLEIKFSNAKESISISKSDLEYEWESRAYEHIRSKVDEETFAAILEIVTANNSSKAIHAEMRRLFKDKPIEVSGVSRSFPFSSIALRDLIEEKESVALKKQNLGFFKAIKDNFPLKTLYLPTYRRVEDLISSLKSDDGIQGNEYIRFGLSDVQATLESIKKEILTSCNDSMSRINGEILNRLVKGLSLTEEDRMLIQNNIDSLGLVLNRFGKSLSQEDKELIAAKVKSPTDFNDERNEALVYFLSKMYSAFLEQREKDNALGRFAEICSSYFVNKKMTYDETTLEVFITCLDTGNGIEFEQLSSGEKQIVSLFSKLMLEKGQGLFVLFDEPELSLSVEWQRQLLPDVINSGSCEMLLAMTHSPFIISNTIDYASDLKSYFIEPVADND
ncbi:AAA family ATPase [Pseudomonas berkeleyensis]|uniref:AAA family ATPase n=1 Tax=Pseudomonas berkeleyensis TaxID=2726956 RepID=A0A7G5DSC6_9PSED|nr:AAA family ATPase [Pseudomonas berkeleyensis]QMV64651.1 AAA family ATPase [Pseudomonas berkeleyensis]WSO40119.1 AAA family ATPase [Pseudomonas berkeleyensis]